MNEEEELVQLKEIYDELWRDAKALIKDTKRSIAVHLYSAITTFSVAFLCVSYFAMYLLALFSGETTMLNYIGVVVEPIGFIVLVIFGVKLLQWYDLLKKRYSKLIEMEKTIED
ncbi:MAG: hypothetical protein QXG76_05565 [Candidatus Bathyarchaeia archaeon]